VVSMEVRRLLWVWLDDDGRAMLGECVSACVVLPAGRSGSSIFGPRTRHTFLHVHHASLYRFITLTRSTALLRTLARLP